MLTLLSGSFAPAGPDTIWKRRLTKESNYETKAYQALMRDSVHNVVPRFYREVEYNGDRILIFEFKNTPLHYFLCPTTTFYAGNGELLLIKYKPIIMGVLMVLYSVRCDRVLDYEASSLWSDVF